MDLDRRKSDGSGNIPVMGTATCGGCNCSVKND